MFSRIPAKNVLLLLDCCFAGGAGAKVFHAPGALKGAASAEQLLQRISGKGRLIFTAAAADQEAIEDRRRGHGLFTFYLLEGLRGAPEVVRDTRIPMLSLVEFVTRSVISLRSRSDIAKSQRFELRLKGEFTFPILAIGSIFRQFFRSTLLFPLKSKSLVWDPSDSRKRFYLSGAAPFPA